MDRGLISFKCVSVQQHAVGIILVRTAGRPDGKAKYLAADGSKWRRVVAKALQKCGVWSHLRSTSFCLGRLQLKELQLRSARVAAGCLAVDWQGNSLLPPLGRFEFTSTSSAVRRDGGFL